MGDLKEKYFLVKERSMGKPQLHIEDIVNVVGAAGFYELLEAKLIFTIDPLPNGEEQRTRYVLTEWRGD